MFLIAVALSKCSIVFFIRRLFTRDHKGAWMICNGMQALIGIWTIVSMLLLTIGCGPSSKLAGDKCNGQVYHHTRTFRYTKAKSSAVNTLDRRSLTRRDPRDRVRSYGSISYHAATDGIQNQGCRMPGLLLPPLVRSRPSLLSLSLPHSPPSTDNPHSVGVFAAIRVHYGFQFARSADPGLGIIPPLIWQEIELGYALISATIPTLRSFIRGYEKAMGWDPSYSASNSHQLQSFHQHSALRSQTRDDPLDVLRSDRQDYKADIWGQPEQGKQDHKRVGSRGSGDSTDPIIRRDVQIHVSSESATRGPWTGTKTP